jgi:hypothetical protein
MICKPEMKAFFITEQTPQGREEYPSRPATKRYLTDKVDLSRGFPPGLSYRS